MPAAQGMSPTTPLLVLHQGHLLPPSQPSPPPQVPGSWMVCSPGTGWWNQGRESRLPLEVQPQPALGSPGWLCSSWPGANPGGRGPRFQTVSRGTLGSCTVGGTRAPRLNGGQRHDGPFKGRGAWQVPGLSHGQARPKRTATYSGRSRHLQKVSRKSAACQPRPPSGLRTLEPALR